MGLEEGIEWIADDELVEVTPESIRLRKNPQAIRSSQTAAGRKRLTLAKRLHFFAGSLAPHAELLTNIT